MKITRRYTTEGQDPFAAFTFVPRNSRIVNPDGSVVFEMKDVLVPDSWSQVAVDVLAYNSKVYFVIFDGGGFGQQVFRLPATGNETVLDAVSLVQGLAPISSKRRIWLARPAPANSGCSQILPVDWNAITPSKELKYHECYGPFECARLEVPLDWSNLSNPNTVAIAITKLPAVVDVTDKSFGGKGFSRISRAHLPSAAR